MIYVFLFWCVVGAASYAIASARHRRQQEAPEAVETSDDSVVLSVLRNHFRDIRMANAGEYGRRLDLLNLSTAIQKLDAGVPVETSVVLALLSRLRGTREAIEQIKGAGA